METVSSNGWSFDLDDSGGGGEAVLLLHGFPQDHTSWRFIADPLQAAGYRTIAPDQRGYSPGARPTKTADYSMANLTADMIGVLDSLDIETAHVIGHDWGGAVAWAMAATHPQRLRSLTVLSTPHPAAMQRAAIRSTQGLRSWYMGLFQLPVLAERMLKPGSPLWSAIMRGLPEESQQRYAGNAQDAAARTAMLQWYRAVPREAVRPSIKWQPIETPTLYIWGQRDPALGAAAAQATADFVVGPYTFVALSGAGHWLPERSSERVTPLILEHLAAHS